MASALFENEQLSRKTKKIPEIYKGGALANARSLYKIKYTVFPLIHHQVLVENQFYNRITNIERFIKDFTLYTISSHHGGHRHTEKLPVLRPFI